MDLNGFAGWTNRQLMLIDGWSKYRSMGIGLNPRMETRRANVGNGHPETYDPACDAVAVFVFCVWKHSRWQSSVFPGSRVHFCRLEDTAEERLVCEGHDWETLPLLRRSFSSCTLYASESVEISIRKITGRRTSGRCRETFQKPVKMSDDQANEQSPTTEVSCEI